MLHEWDHKLQPEERYGDGEDAVDERLQAALISCLKLNLRLCEFGFHKLFRACSFVCRSRRTNVERFLWVPFTLLLLVLKNRGVYARAE